MVEENPYYIAKKPKAQMAKAKDKVINHDTDRVFIVDGREGSGKSTIALQFAYYFDPTFCLDDIVFTADDFAKKVRSAERHKAIVFDEGFNGLSSKGVLSKANKELVRLLQECRQRNLFIFIVLPTIFLLEKYVAIFRSHALIHVTVSSQDIKKRYYKIYNYNNKKLLYIKGKEKMSYWYPKIYEGHRFYAKYPPTINDEEYRAKKNNAFKVSDITNKAKNDDKYMEKYHLMLYHMQKELNLSLREAAAWATARGLPLSKTYMAEIQRKYAEMSSVQSPVYNNINVKKTMHTQPSLTDKKDDKELDEVIAEEFPDYESNDEDEDQPDDLPETD